jgi:hypothetical protein
MAGLLIAHGSCLPTSFALPAYVLSAARFYDNPSATVCGSRSRNERSVSVNCVPFHATSSPDGWCSRSLMPYVASCTLPGLCDCVSRTKTTSVSAGDSGTS